MIQHLLGYWDTGQQVCVRGKTTLQEQINKNKNIKKKSQFI